MLGTYWKRISLFTIAFAVLAFIVSALMPKKYEGILQILIDQKPVTGAVALSAEERSIVDLTDFARPRGIATQVQQLTSYGVLEDAGAKARSSLGVAQAQGDEFSYATLVENIRIDAESASDLITLRVRMSSEDRARALANEIYSSFTQFNERSARELGQQAKLVLENQRSSIQGQLDKIENSIRDLKNQLGTPDVNSQLASDISANNRLKDARDLAAIDLAQAEGRMEVLAKMFESEPKYLKSSDTTAYNTNLQALDQLIANEKANLEGMLERYLPDHEQVLAQQKKIAKLEGSRAAMEKTISASTTNSLNPSRQQLELEYKQTEAAVRSLQKRYDEASSTYEAALQTLTKYPDAQKQVEKLTRDRDLLVRSLAGIENQLKSVEITGQGRVAPTRLAGIGTDPDPVSPKTTSNIIIGAFLGFILGVLTMLRKEAKEQPIRSLPQLNTLAFAPVYRVIPNLRLPFRGKDKNPPEQFETLLVNGLRSTKRPYKVGFVGLVRDSGASTAAVNYCISASRRGMKSHLVGLDTKSVTLRRLFGSNPELGKKLEVSQGFSCQVIDATDVALGSEGKGFISQVGAEGADIIAVDFLPSGTSSDYAFLASHLDEIIIMVRANQVKSVDFLTVQEAIRESGCPHTTVVLTRASEYETSTPSSDSSQQVSALPS